MIATPKKAFVLAAGMGERMRPLTDRCPKPLLAVGGRTMLDRCLDALEDAGVDDVVVNTFYLGAMIEEHVRRRRSPRIMISRESALLDTGGGVKKMLPFFGEEPFYVLNADIVWTDGREPALKALAGKWDASKMDLLLLLHKSADGKGDYHLAEGSDRPVFAQKSGNYIFAGPRIVHPRLFDPSKDGAFSFLELFHKAENQGRLCGLRHDGEWHHVGTPGEFAETNRILSEQPGKKAAP